MSKCILGYPGASAFVWNEEYPQGLGKGQTGGLPDSEQLWPPLLKDGGSLPGSPPHGVSAQSHRRQSQFPLLDLRFNARLRRELQRAEVRELIGLLRKREVLRIGISGPGAGSRCRETSEALLGTGLEPLVTELKGQGITWRPRTPRDTTALGGGPGALEVCVL